MSRHLLWGPNCRYLILRQGGAEIAMRMRGTTVDYGAALSVCPSLLYEEKVAYLYSELPALWQKAYRKMAQSPTSIHPFSQHGFEFLFDRASELRAKGVVKGERVVEDRIIVVYGRSLPVTPMNDCNRHLLGSASAQFGQKSERPYLPGSVLGRNFDISLYPQHRDLEGERSSDGRAFRAMSKYCCDNPGTFCFTRLIYASKTWRPSAIEHGLLKVDGMIWVRSFKNEMAESRPPLLQWTTLLGRKISRESSPAD